MDLNALILRTVFTLLLSIVPASWISCEKKSQDQITEQPWITPAQETYHIYHFMATQSSKGDPYANIWAGREASSSEPFLWAFAGDRQYVLEFETMTGAKIPSTPCKLIFWQTRGRP
jgi:hypothetical protein